MIGVDSIFPARTKKPIRTKKEKKENARKQIESNLLVETLLRRYYYFALLLLRLITFIYAFYLRLIYFKLIELFFTVFKLNYFSLKKIGNQLLIIRF